MKETAPRPVLLARYAPFPFRVLSVALTFRLGAAETEVDARIAFVREAWAAPGAGLRLDGEGLTLRRAAIDGRAVDAEAWRDADGGLTVPAACIPSRAFVWEATVAIAPGENASVSGLFLADGLFCTHCEAQGFRRITFYPDRPDVTAPFRVRIEADLPVLLSNGNLIGSGPGWAEWDDPWPKPCYLFALVAGRLAAVPERFVTASGRAVRLAVWVRPGPDEAKCGFALEALKRAMRWEEEVHGREYDLDVLNLVAIDGFSHGAMENKGLNIFNSRYLLASPMTATDVDFEAIEALVAHEYFHNWTGNRVTCRGWFQLCLKEGLTVFRERAFTGGLRPGAARIRQARLLQGRQFREDSGPLAHPVRPTSYLEIDTLYTATVYEKGAEIVGMLRRLVGDDAYRRAVGRFLDRFDGRGATVEDWLGVFEEVSGRDLGQFGLWYTQAGTPRLTVDEVWNDGTLTLICRQETPPTPGQPVKRPLHIPILVGFIGRDGRPAAPTMLIEMTEREQRFIFSGLAERPVPSILRDFSAPVLIERISGPEERAFRFAHDGDPYARWDAGRMLTRDILVAMIAEGGRPGPAYFEAVGRMVADERLDPAFRALALALPSEDDIAQALSDLGKVPDPLRIHCRRRDLHGALARQLEPVLRQLYRELEPAGAFSPAPRAAAARALRLAILSLISRLDEGATAARLFETADNMTDIEGALAALLDNGRGGAELARVYRRWSGNRLVIDRWFALQALHAAPDEAPGVVRALSKHPAFSLGNPCRFRALFGSFAANLAGFHAESGEGYALLAEWTLALDAVDPRGAARMLAAFATWRRHDARRQALMRGELECLAAAPRLSVEAREVAARILGAS